MSPLAHSIAGPIMMILDRNRGPMTTGEICDVLAVSGAVQEVRRVRHGVAQPSARKIAGTDMTAHVFEECPDCTCTEKVEVSRSYMSPYVRQALHRLADRGSVVEIPTETPNNKGGHLWLRADRVDEYYRKVFS